MPIGPNKILVGTPKWFLTDGLDCPHAWEEFRKVILAQAFLYIVGSTASPNRVQEHADMAAQHPALAERRDREALIRELKSRTTGKPQLSVYAGIQSSHLGQLDSMFEDERGNLFIVRIEDTRPKP